MKAAGVTRTMNVTAAETLASPPLISKPVSQTKDRRGNRSQTSSTTWLPVPRRASNSQSWGSSPLSPPCSFPEKEARKNRNCVRIVAAAMAATANATSPDCCPSEDEPTPSSSSFYRSTSASPSVSSTPAYDFEMDSWRATRATRKTTRRRALAICLSLAGFTSSSHSPSRLEQQPAATEFISVSRSTGGAVTSELPAPKTSDDYGDLVTVSTGSSASPNDGTVKGLPSWMRGNYHLCMGDGFHVQVPADWQMQDTQGEVYGAVLRYVDNSDSSTHVVILKSPTTETRMGGQADSEGWISKQAYLQTGEQDSLQPRSEVDKSIAEVVNVSEPITKQGLTYHTYEFVTRQGANHGDEVHELVSAVVNNGDLYLCLVRSLEDRWQKGTQATAQRIIDSFQITGFKIHS